MYIDLLVSWLGCVYNELMAVEGDDGDGEGGGEGEEERQERGQRAQRRGERQLPVLKSQQVKF